VRDSARERHAKVLLGRHHLSALKRPKGISRHHGERGHHAYRSIGGDTFAKTSFGSVSTERINGNLTVRTAMVRSSAFKKRKGDAGVKTSFAGVTLESIGGAASLCDNQNGRSPVTAMRPASGCREHFAHDIVLIHPLRVPEGLGYNLTAEDIFRPDFLRIASHFNRQYRGRYSERNLSVRRLPASAH